MRELDERILSSWPLMLTMALFFGAAFALVFGLIALIMEGLFIVDEQALMAGTAAFSGFLFVALHARSRLPGQGRDRNG